MNIFLSIKSHIILWVMESRFYNWVLKNIIPYIRISFYYSDMRGYKYKRAYKLLQIGDIILCKDKWKLTTWLIPGEFSHACLCVGKGNDGELEFEIAEMTHNGFTKSTFYDVFREATRLVILRCRDWDYDYRWRVVGRCIYFNDVPYDNSFTLGIKSLYCSELIYEADFERRLKVSLEDLMGLGRPYISPEGLYKAENVEKIWDSDNEIRYMRWK